MQIYFDKESNKLVSSNLLLKISKIEYLQELQNGKLYMNMLSSFRRYEQQGMGDNEEGLFAQYNEGALLIDGVEFANVKNIKAYAFDKNPIFCIMEIPLIEIQPGHYECIVKQQLFKDFMLDSNIKYGALLICKDIFAHLLKQKMNELSIGWYWDKVTYDDSPPKFSKKELYKVAFHKREKFAHQHEWRLMLFDEVDDHYELNIGSLKCCSQIFPLDFNNTDMKITVLLNE